LEGSAVQFAPVLAVLRFFEPPLRLTLRVPDGFGLATPHMASFRCAGPSVKDASIASPSMLVPNSDFQK